MSVVNKKDVSSGISSPDEFLVSEKVKGQTVKNVRIREVARKMAYNSKTKYSVEFIFGGNIYRNM